MADANAVQGHGVHRRRAERDVPQPRRRVQQEGGRRERAHVDARHRHLHLRPPPAAALQPRRGPDRRDSSTRSRTASRDRHQAGVHQVRRRRAGRHPERREGTPRRGTRSRCRPAGRSWPLAPVHGTGLEQMRIFAEEGVDPATVQIAHTGDTDTSTTSSACSTPAAGSAWTATASTSSSDRAAPRPARPARARLRRPHVPLSGLLLDVDWFTPEVQELPEGQRGARTGA